MPPPLRSQQRSRGQGTQGNKCAYGEEGSQGGVPSEVSGTKDKGPKEAYLPRYQGEGSQGGVPSEVPRGKGPKEAYLPRYQGGRVSRRRTFLRFQVPTEVPENGQSP